MTVARRTSRYVSRVDLQESLIGTWRLLSRVDRLLDGTHQTGEEDSSGADQRVDPRPG